MNFAVSVACLLEMLAAWFTKLLTNDVYVRLTTTNVAITKNTNLSTLAQCTFGGYAPVKVTAFDGPYLDSNGNPYGTTPLCAFQANGTTAPDTVQGVYLTESTGAAATATATEAGGIVNAITVTAGGSGYLSPPVVTITDATTGVGAAATATIVGGIVTAITITNGGTLYTGPIITIEKPCRLIGGAQLTTPRQMGAVSDGLPIVVQPAITE